MYPTPTLAPIPTLIYDISSLKRNKHKGCDKQKSLDITLNTHCITEENGFGNICYDFPKFGCKPNLMSRLPDSETRM